MRLLWWFALLCCVGCEPFVPVITLAPSDREALRRTIPTKTRAEVEHLSVGRLGVLEATSCQLGLTSPAATPDDAIDQLRYKAAVLGGNALTDVLCEPRQGMSVSKNCYNSVVCHATAIHWSNTP